MMKTEVDSYVGAFICLACRAEGGSQLQKISVELEDVSVVTLIKELKRQTGVNFLYNVDEVTRNGRISVSVQDWTVEEVLNKFLPGKGLSFSVVNDVLMIRPLEKRADEQQEGKVVIKGVVKDGGGVRFPA